MVHIRNAADVRLERVTVAHSKGYAVWVQNTDGFEFDTGQVINAGVLGLYVGHTRSQPTTRLVIKDSVFRDNQTNALALLGVTATEGFRNRVTGNTFEHNHRRGQWKVAPRYGDTFTGGGQVYLADAQGVDFHDNRIAHGYCNNCLLYTSPSPRDS